MMAMMMIFKSEPKHDDRKFRLDDDDDNDDDDDDDGKYSSET